MFSEYLQGKIFILLPLFCAKIFQRFKFNKSFWTGTKRSIGTRTESQQGIDFYSRNDIFIIPQMKGCKTENRDYNSLLLTFV